MRRHSQYVSVRIYTHIPHILIHTYLYTYTYIIKIKSSLQYFNTNIQVGDNVKRSRIAEMDKEGTTTSAGRVAVALMSCLKAVGSGFDMIFSWVAAKLISLR